MVDQWTDARFKNPQAFMRAYQKGHRPRLEFDDHAIKRYIEMGLSKDEVTDAIVEPEQVTFDPKYQAVLLSAGRLTVSVVVGLSGEPFVATMLFRFQEDWHEAYRTGRAGGVGRTQRDVSHLPKRNVHGEQ